ncbi:MAG TPA: hypothetical protein VFY65_01345 [Longimicrobium sp.]|nr:hypothetical protein [Longimicrobium sp.]
MSRGGRLYGAIAAVCVLLFPFPARAQGVEVSGVARWTDPGNGTHAVRRARVEVVDADSGVVLDTTRTDETGAYRVALAAPDVRAVYVVVVSQTAHVDVVEPTVRRPYGVRSRDQLLPPDGYSLIVEDVVGARDSVSNQALAIADALEYGADFRFRRTGTAPPPVAAAFPADTSVPCFDGAQLLIPRESVWEWDVVLHEYGHFVSRLDALANSPGGPHSLDAPISPPKHRAVRVAWAEGWATYFSVAAQIEAGLANLRIPWVGDTLYTSRGFAPVNLNLLSPHWSFGERSEVSVMRVLYNLADDDPGTPTPEHAALGAQRLWDLLRSGRPETLSDAWRLLAGGLSHDETVAAALVLEMHQAAPAPRRPADGAPLPAAAPTFEWYKQGNDRFSVVVSGPAGNVLYRKDDLTDPWHDLAQSDWRRIRADAVGGPVFWHVEGTATSDPSTGPYRSSSRRLGP